MVVALVEQKLAVANNPNLMTISKLVFIELWKRKSQLITGLLAITLGIAVIVAIQSVSVVS